MISAAFAGIIAGSVTSLTPMGYAPDSASAGLLISLAASISAAAGAAGASPADRILNALFALWLTAILSFGTMWVLGSFRVAKLARFVPFSVVAGFLGATGILLIVAGLSLALGHPFDGKILASDLNDANIGKVLASVILATLLMALRAGWKDWRIILADALLIAAFGFVILHLQRAGGGAGLFLEGLGDIHPWSPWTAASQGAIHWNALLSHAPQIFAVIIVVQISNIVKVSTVEVTHSEAADLDAEFRYNGGAVLASALLGGLGAEKLEPWLTSELGPDAAKVILPYFERKPLKAKEVLYREGDPAGTIDLVTEGSIAIVLKREGEADYQLRLMETHTIVGEMGFFRKTSRAASVVAAEDGVVYSLSREAYARLQMEDAGAANSFLEFIIRTLSDRVSFVNQETAALL